MYQSFAWISSCIESSSNHFQFECCRKLIALFTAKHKDLPNWSKEISDKLEAKLTDQETKHNLDA